jgi:hypothetical protein
MHTGVQVKVDLRFYHPRFVKLLLELPVMEHPLGTVEGKHKVHQAVMAFVDKVAVQEYVLYTFPVHYLLLNMVPMQVGEIPGQKKWPLTPLKIGYK